MKYSFDTDALVYMTNFMNSLAMNAPNRHARRHIHSLANKFSPPRTRVDLKPLERQQVIQIANIGLRAMADVLEKEEDAAKKEHGQRVQGILTEVVRKISGAPKTAPCVGPVTYGDVDIPQSDIDNAERVSQEPQMPSAAAHDEPGLGAQLLGAGRE